MKRRRGDKVFRIPSSLRMFRMRTLFVVFGSRVRALQTSRASASILFRNEEASC